MTLRKATFTVTADSQAQPVNNPTRCNQGSSTVHLPPSTATRHAQLMLVTVDVSAAVSKDVDVVINELVAVANLPLASTTAETYHLGKQLFYVDLKTIAALQQSTAFGDVYQFDPRHPAISAVDGATPPYDALVGTVILREDDVRCEVFKMAPADVVTVNMYYETAGDYRF